MVLSKILNVGKSVVEAIKPTKAKIENVKAVLNIAFNPFAKGSIEANVKNPALKKGLELVANHPYASAGVVAGGITAVTNPAVAGKVATSLIPRSTIGKLGAVASVPVIAGIITKKPVESAEAIVKTPSSLYNVGGNIADVVANPSIENLSKLAKENPVIVGGATAIGVIAGAKAILPAVATAMQTSAIRGQTEAIQDATASINMGGAGGILKEKMLETSSAMPLTPQTTTISAGKTRRKRARAKEKPSVNQRVNIMIKNASKSVGIANKRYIKERVVC